MATTIRFVLIILIKTLFVAGFFFSLPAHAEEQNNVETLLEQSSQYLKTAPEKSVLPLAQLQRMTATLTEGQKERLNRLLINSLAFRGKYKEQVELILSVIDRVKDPEVRATFLYNLSDGYTNIGEYERALGAMNEGILLLPKLVSIKSRMNTLQASVSLLSSLRAYDEALLYADRIYALDPNDKYSVSRCIGLGDKVEINFLRGKGELARTILPEAIQVCNTYGSKILVLIVRTLDTIDLIDTLNDDQDLNLGLSLLSEFSKANETSDYVTKLEESISRAYFRKGNLFLAERYGHQAYLHAISSSVFQLMDKTSENMTAIKRAQGQLKSALEYYDINLALKKKVLDDQLHKNLAYQRVKFDMQDKANQLALSEQKNKTLTIEKALQQGKNQNLLLLMTLGLILLTILGAWLIRTLRQKNFFRTSAQIDGLTQVSNRAHFMDCSTQAFKDTESHASVVLFDMDHFKKINDTFGHAAGDWVLKTVCATVKTHLRKTDIFGRLGGEEFAIGLSGISQEEVQALAERCRLAISEIDSNPCGFSFIITASFGLATRGIRGHSNFEETLAGADKALYFSKNEGRNRVSVFQ